MQKNGHDVVAVMTRSAEKFVGALTFEAITRREVITDQYKAGANADIEHIAIASNIDLLLVAPATANTIGKFANGLADDFLSSLYTATRAPVMIAPAMNTNMFDHPAVAKNLETLIARGVHIVDPGSGYLACGWIGKGRLAEPEDVVGVGGAAAEVEDGGDAGRTQHPDHRRADLRRHRSGALRRQSIERPHGIRAGRRSAAPRRGGDAGDRADAPDRRRTAPTS